MYVTTRCKEIADKKYTSVKTTSDGSTKHDAAEQGKILHQVLSNTEEVTHHLFFVSESNRREAELIHLINKLHHLKVEGITRELKLVLDLKGETFSGRVDQLNWDATTKTLEIVDLKTHSTKLTMKNNKPDVCQHTEFYYRLQLHFYAKMIKTYLLDELTPEIQTILRRKLVGGLLNVKKPIHPVISSTCSLKPEISIDDLFTVFLRLRSEFVGAKVKLSIYHIDQTSMQNAIQLNQPVDAIAVSYRYIPSFLSDQEGSDKAYMMARKRGHAEAMTAAKKSTSKVVKKRKKRRV